MSNGTDLRFTHATGLLTKLTRTVADFAKQEAELTGSLSTRNYQEIRRHREEAHKVDTALAAQIAEGDSVAVNGVCLTATQIEEIGRAHV